MILSALTWLIGTTCSIVIIIMLTHVVLSWLLYFNVINRRNELINRLYLTFNTLVEPMTAPIRRFLPKLGGIDLSPLVVIIGAGFVQRLVGF